MPALYSTLRVRANSAQTALSKTMNNGSESAGVDPGSPSTPD